MATVIATFSRRVLEHEVSNFCCCRLIEERALFVGKRFGSKACFTVVWWAVGRRKLINQNQFFSSLSTVIGQFLTTCDLLHYCRTGLSVENSFGWLGFICGSSRKWFHFLDTYVSGLSISRSRMITFNLIRLEPSELKLCRGVGPISWIV